MQKDMFLKDSICPECNTKGIYFDWGYIRNYNIPQENPTIYCNNCGWNDSAFDDNGIRHTLLKDLILCFNHLADNILSEHIPDYKRRLALVEKRLFKATESGIAFSHKDDYVECVPYVEGFDEDLQSIIVYYPFTMDEFWEAVESADKIACHVWTCINEHDKNCECYLYY